MKQELLARLSALGILPEKEAIDLMLSTGSPSRLCDLLEEESKERGSPASHKADGARPCNPDPGKKSQQYFLSQNRSNPAKSRSKPSQTRCRNQNHPSKRSAKAKRRRDPRGANWSGQSKPISSNPEGLEVTILKNYTQTNAKAAMENFVFYFNSRYEKLRNLLSKRQLQNTTSIMHLKPGQRPRS